MKNTFKTIYEWLIKKYDPAKKERERISKEIEEIELLKTEIRGVIRSIETATQVHAEPDTVAESKIPARTRRKHRRHNYPTYTKRVRYRCGVVLTMPDGKEIEFSAQRQAAAYLSEKYDTVVLRHDIGNAISKYNGVLDFGGVILCRCRRLKEWNG